MGRLDLTEAEMDDPVGMMASLKEKIRDFRVKRRLFRKYRLTLGGEHGDIFRQMPYLRRGPVDPKVRRIGIEGRLFRSSSVDRDTREEMLDWFVERGIKVKNGTSEPDSQVARITADEAFEFKMRWL